MASTEPKMLPRFLEVQGQTYRAEDLLAGATHRQIIADVVEGVAMGEINPYREPQLMQTIRNMTGYQGPALPYDKMLELADTLRIEASALEQTVFDAAK